jgi:hypothetical protein
MPGGFYPTLGYPVAWSLSGAPSGVTIDNYDLITVSGTAQLSDVNSITVKAAYHGRTYEAVFGITKARGGTPGTSGKDGKDGKDGDTGPQGDPAPRYRGATGTADTGNTGIVNVTGKPSSVMRPGDWVMFTGSSGWEYAFIKEMQKDNVVFLPEVYDWPDIKQINTLPCMAPSLCILSRCSPRSFFSLKTPGLSPRSAFSYQHRGPWLSWF